MNTGVCDAHNLAWKLAAVVQGRAGDALLDTYTCEWRPGEGCTVLGSASVSKSLLAQSALAAMASHTLVGLMTRRFVYAVTHCCRRPPTAMHHHRAHPIAHTRMHAHVARTHTQPCLAAASTALCPSAIRSHAAERKLVGTANMLLSVANFNEALRVPQVSPWPAGAAVLPSPRPSFCHLLCPRTRINTFLGYPCGARSLSDGGL